MLELPVFEVPRDSTFSSPWFSDKVCYLPRSTPRPSLSGFSFPGSLVVVEILAPEGQFDPISGRGDRGKQGSVWWGLCSLGDVNTSTPISWLAVVLRPCPVLFALLSLWKLEVWEKTPVELPCSRPG